ncbi:putative intracellular protease/amidase [Actinocorallia herbida]|uniref:Putative intracellular protease/amidase n=1 Tax=Actinocorallia herbida TaxID=58109 RepID=A0A3N1D560_9ACTN|nr:type 1 glutamine amidotransferase domain-containing protein [Actinocorallia herbida]ROO88685.1 putative intracellular protease/amidase [Actinocorallia herbida]
MAKVLFVMTGARSWTLNDGTAHPTGFWAEEAVAPWRVLTGAGHEVVFASPGGAVPVPDEASLTVGANGDEDGARAVAEGLGEMTGLKSPLKLEHVDPADYAAVFYPGGHGPMEDLAVDAASGALITAQLDAGRPLALVCHGPAALLAARGADGAPAVAGYRLTGFTDEEERQGGLADKAPWLLQDRLVDLGAEFDEGAPWRPHLVADRTLLTGQNPASAEPLAKELLALLPG